MYLTAPVLHAAVFTSVAQEEQDVIDFYSFGSKLHDKTHIKIVVFIGEYIYCTAFLQFPCLIALSLCVIIHRYGLILRQFNVYLRSMNMQTKYADYNDVLRNYNIIEEKIHLLKRSLSLPLFIVLLNGFFVLYTVLSLSLYNEFRPYMMVEMGCNAFTGVFLLSSSTIFASGIPRYISEIKNTVAFLIEERQLSKLNRDKEIRILERMEKKDLIYLSACGIVDFKKSFLLTAFGTLLTYGLLIMRLN
ncbi:hypothetical protein AVEN_74339-1 [Araneus ventricosus]|uniref:Gustatory receptor n=1 Tax=Araneus ventricosus TaxID=182803 RepID=A0A4Y2PGR9_ARAVE|nr:hypothetical protein AVEN_74339-1 [Araneus ventricosus]